MRIETTEFIGWFTSFGGYSSDSVVGLFQSGSKWQRLHGETETKVLKWNRQPIFTAEEARAAAYFKEQSIFLYTQALGREYIVNTDVSVGTKNDQNGIKHKVFQMQPYISGWSAKDAPEEMALDSSIVSQWQELSGRLFHLYQAAQEVNREYPEEQQFPITMTIGSSRLLSLYAEDSQILPKTNNIIVREDDGMLQLFDFGPYTRWNEGMRDTYTLLLEKTQLPRSGDIFQKEEGIYA